MDGSGSGKVLASPVAPNGGGNLGSPQGVDWRAAFVGAAVGIAGPAYFGTLITNASLRLLLAQGRSVQEAYAYLDRFELSAPMILELAAFLACMLACGWISAAYARRASNLQGLIAGSLAATFPLVMSFNPISQGTPPWYMTVQIALPLVASFVGAYLFKRMAQH